MRFRDALLLFLASPSLFAADFGTLNLADARLPLHKRFVLTAHSRFRSDHDFSRYLQSRAGAIGLTQLTPKIALVTGYYFIDQGRPSQTGRDSWHRLFTGPLIHPIRKPNFVLESRTLHERFFSVPSGDFNRFRQRLWVDLPRTPLQPWMQVEGLLTRVPGPGGAIANRFTRRYGGGIGLQAPNSMRLRLGLEYRQNIVGPGMVNLVSIVEWRPAKLR
ncbi:MAG: hypothetical protein J0L64_10410 [Acidobacteria bacterium]|nr:hypothetical protein [Acidobacteriota bacterium]